MRRVFVVAMLGIVGCGGGTDTVTPPPPPAPVAAVDVTPSSATLVPGQTQTLSATTRDARGSVLSGRNIVWNSATSAVATVDASGVVTAVAPGTASVTATSEGKSGTAQITVQDGAVVGAAGRTFTAHAGDVTVVVPAQALNAPTTITVKPTASPPANPNLVANTAYDFGPNGTTFAQPVTLRIRYGASLPAGLVPEDFRLHRLTNNAWVEVTGSTVDVGTRTVSGPTSSFSTYAVLQKPGVPASMTISPTTPTIVARATLNMIAVVKDSTGRTITAPVSWQSSDQAVATVDAATGKVTAVSPGTSTMTATSGSVVATTLLTVTSVNLNSIVETIRAQYNVPAMGGAIVTRTGKLIAIGVAGNRRWGTISPVTVADKWHLGSDAKMMTAMVVALAVKAGKLSWTDLMVNRYPELAPVARPEFAGVTLRSLGSMQADIIGNPGIPLTGTTAEQRLQIDQWAVQQPPAAAPGTYYYSNISYQMLAEIAGRAWGNGFEQALRDQVWTPLGITSGGFGPTTGVGMSDQPNGHTENGNGWTVCESCDNAWATGSGRVHISIPDWARYIWEVLRADAGQSSLLNQAEARVLTSQATPEPTPRWYYGFGWDVYDGPDRLVKHAGTNTLNLAVVTAYLNPGVAYLVTTNAGGSAAGAAVNALTTRLQTYYATGQ